MAWVDVPGSSSVWQYENTATAANTYSDSGAGANSAFSGGVRTYTKPCLLYTSPSPRDRG